MSLHKNYWIEKWSFGFSAAAFLWLMMPFVFVSLPSFGILLCFLLFLFCYAAGLLLYLNKPASDSWLAMLTAVLLILETLPVLFVVVVWLLLTVDSGPGFSLG